MNDKRKAKGLVNIVDMFLIALVLCGTGYGNATEIAGGNSAKADIEAETPGKGEHVYWKYEAEDCDPITSKWSIADQQGASGGKVLFIDYYDGADSVTRRIDIPRTGVFRLWVRHFNRKSTCGQFRLTLFDRDGAIVAEKLMATTPAGQNGPRWDSVEAIIPRAEVYRLELARTSYSARPYDARKIDLILITDDLEFKPDLLTLGDLPASLDGKHSEFHPSRNRYRDTPFTSDAAMNDWRFFCGLPIKQSELRSNGLSPFWLSVRQSPSANYVQMIRYGGNCDEGYRAGFPSLPIRSGIEGVWRQFLTGEHATGHVLNEKGESGKFPSIFYPPFRKAVIDYSQHIARELGKQDPNRELIGWTLQNEPQGYLDWSKFAKKEFIKWLTDKYNHDIAQLNSSWGTSYLEFSNIVLPVNREKKAPWIDWFGFHEQAWADFFREDACARFQSDPDHSPVVVKFSNLQILSGDFTPKNPIEIELMTSVSDLAGGKFALDLYSGADSVGYHSDFLRSIYGPGFWFTEYNQHTDDPGLMLANLWSATAKGLRGMFLFCWGGLNSSKHNGWQVFGMHTSDAKPKQRMLTSSRFFHSVHRLEPLIVNSQYVEPKQVIGLFYPRLDLVINDLPAKSSYGEQINSIIPVYSLLRQSGYPVDIVTEKQLLEGKLDKLSAMVLVNAQYLTKEACVKLTDFVEGGGALIGDIRTGWYDDHAREHRALETLFGVEEQSGSYTVDADKRMVISPAVRNMPPESSWMTHGSQNVSIRSEHARVIGELGDPVNLSPEHVYLRAEAETFIPSTEADKAVWISKPKQDASEHGILFSTYFDGHEKAERRIFINKTGRYRIWIRHWNYAEKYGQFSLACYDSDDSLLNKKTIPGSPADKTGWRWGFIDVDIPVPGRVYKLQLSRITGARQPYDARYIDLALITDDLDLEPDIYIAKAAMSAKEDSSALTDNAYPPANGSALQTSPGAVINSYGEGSTLYFPTMLGSFDVDSTDRSGQQAVGRMLSLFLLSHHIEPQYKLSALPQSVRDGLRVEPLWVDGKTNQYIVITQFASEPTGPFELTFPLKEKDKPGLALWADASSMMLEPIDLEYGQGVATATIPDVKSAGTLLLLSDFTPLISASLESVKMDKDTDTPIMNSGDKATLDITVYNPSPEALDGVDVYLYTSRGWYQEMQSKPLDKLASGGSAKVKIAFRIPHAEREQIAPVTIKLKHKGRYLGTPCTIMVKVRSSSSGICE